MPGLSDYKNFDRYTVDAPEPGLDEFINKQGGTGQADRMRQRYLDSLGFADLRRSAPDSLMHEMMQNIPRSEWDKPMSVLTQGEPQEVAPDMWVPNNEMSPRYTFRQLMEALGKMRPNEQQGP